MSSREKAQIMKKSGMKRVLLLGSGYVSGPIVEYLTRDEKTQVTVGGFASQAPLQYKYTYYKHVCEDMVSVQVCSRVELHLMVSACSNSTYLYFRLLKLHLTGTYCTFYCTTSQRHILYFLLVT